MTEGRRQARFASPRRRRRRRLAATRILIAAGLLLALPAAAAKVKIFRVNSASSYLEGTLSGVSLDALGTLRLAQRIDKVAAIEEPFLLSAAVTDDGWVVGTGNAGRVLLIAADGATSELFAADEPEVFAVWVDDSGAVYAGSSPDGKVYRYRDGSREIVFEPKQKYIWALVGAGDGGLLVATGTEGKLFRVTADGKAEVIYDSAEPHLRTLLRDENRFYLGTAGDGLVLEVATDGAVRTLFDAAQPEITSLAVSPQGDLYAAALASEASFVDLSGRPAPSQTPAAPSPTSEKPAATVSVQEGAAAAGSRPQGFSGARSEVVRISAAGASESLWRFEKETVFSLLFEQRLWVATGLEGKLYSLREQQMVLEKDVDELQIVSLLPGGAGPAFATTNAAAFYRTSGGVERRGVYTSDVLDAGAVARFGTLHWQGTAVAGSAVSFQVRSGMSSEPDATWSQWSAAAATREVALGDVPFGRYVQWRANLEGSDAGSPELVAVDLSYVPENRRPKIEKLAVLEPGEIVVPANFNPSDQAFEPAHPNRDRIFTTIGKPSDGNDGKRRKKLWKLGYRTLEWEVEDPDGDELRYSLFFRREGSRGWLPIAEDLKDDYYSFDATVLPDGLYRFRLLASDAGSNLGGESKSGERMSEVVAVDHSPPSLEGVESGAGVLQAEVSDSLSPLREAVYSVDAGEWKPVAAVDGLVDGRRERLRLEVPAQAQLLLLRLTDAANNVTTFDLSSSLTGEARRGGR